MKVLIPAMEHVELCTMEPVGDGTFKCSRPGCNNYPQNPGVRPVCPAVPAVQVGWAFWCPGCDRHHRYWTMPNPNAPNRPMWSFNGNVECPTFSPSLLINAGHAGTCHLFVENGQIKYCSDCSHALAGKTVPMVEWPLKD